MFSFAMAAARIIVTIVLLWPVASAKGATKVALLYLPSGTDVGSFVAKDQGFFEKHNLEVELSIAQNPALIAPALIADSAQIGVLSPPVLLEADEQGMDLTVLAGTHRFPIVPGVEGFLVRTNSGIKTALDLTGRKVAVPGFGSSVHIITKSWVEAAGLDFHKVAWVELQFPQMGDALKSELVDAAAMVNPFLSRVLGSGVAISLGDFAASIPAGTSPALYVSTRAWASRNSTAVAQFRAAMNEATEFINDRTNLETVKASIAKYTKLPPEAAATLTVPQNIDAHAGPENLTYWINVLRHQGLTKTDPDPTSLLAP
jgi:NitT/TauT family transport system substrate-binding protein